LVAHGIGAKPVSPNPFRNRVRLGESFRAGAIERYSAPFAASHAVMRSEIGENKDQPLKPVNRRVQLAGARHPHSNLRAEELGEIR
jgi:hypothetical protein